MTVEEIVQEVFLLGRDLESHERSDTNAANGEAVRSYVDAELGRLTGELRALVAA